MASLAPRSLMRRILESVGVENSVIVNFEAQDVTPEIVSTISDAQLVELGVTTLGKRQIIRNLCRDSNAGNASAARAAVNAAFGYPQQQQQQLLSSQNDSPGPVANVLSEARALVQSLSASNRAGGKLKKLLKFSTGGEERPPSGVVCGS
ncbi:hypothetical protein ACROYT_G019132 [Oculina patagonica]